MWCVCTFIVIKNTNNTLREEKPFGLLTINDNCLINRSQVHYICISTLLRIIIDINSTVVRPTPIVRRVRPV